MEQDFVTTTDTGKGPFVIMPEALLDHWQGHRKLTRKMIEAFPEDKFFNYSIGGMRPFAELVMEMTRLAALGMHGVSTGDWTTREDLRRYTEAATASKAEILALWDEVTELINRLWPTIKAGDFQRVDLAFGLYELPVYSIILYWIDNEVHHRGQAYVYLRSLEIEPPPFWERW
ncbi:MAG: DinB family protein [Chitinophagaceae bacterium]|nr:DinB family protein [Chitinophagaceae bacterium]